MEETITPKIEIKKGSIATLQVNAIVNPANSYGYMGGGVAGVLKKVGGQVIEDEAVHQSPIIVGEAKLTTSGDLPCGKIIHAPTMHNPGERTDSHKVMCAVAAALELADKEGFRIIAIPGMGTGVGGIDKQEAAETIIQTIKETKFHSVEKIILIDIDDEMVKAFEKALNKS
ncbi:MAG: macro domain-containing protein [Nanoarchaeota archaeon]|nr:macro domain-containing protein [Nanoarchaeota archaeon]MBU1320762.1 macro domain-containing protein [Nanoarchaeota archaeon]MBU1598129.1 macro domain-containing protein [Nanoarchaeota archaeon]MBU2441967.1 macro domain-containing protein [Nanoarchaeota archaeon]